MVFWNPQQAISSMPELVYFDRIFAETKKCNGVISMHKEQECPTPMIFIAVN